MLILGDGERLDPRIARDPRLSGAQREALIKLGGLDPQAEVDGLDQKMRPVVRATLAHREDPVTYSLLRNGDPAKPVMPLAEPWRGRRSS